jgi:uncharacterized protein YjiS (DUF1127 family)
MNAVFHGSSAIPASGTRSGYAIRRSPGGGAVASAAGALLRVVDDGLDHLVEKLFTWQRRIADRRSLETLDDRMLRDIGITRAEVHQEASKPFWKP